VRSRWGPLVLGADPSGPLLEAWGIGDSAEGLERFTDVVLDAAIGTVGLVKPQSAFFERHGWPRIRALSRLLTSARDAGLLVILDVKRGMSARRMTLEPGRIGPIGAVIGPAHMEPSLDLPSAHALFLAPGVGAQGATPADVARTFAACPDRVMPGASRSLLSAGPDTAALRDATAALAAAFCDTLPVQRAYP
jgi:orotidine-5'-phosphate decarboxylase